MRLTESKLKQLINEEYEMMLFENSIMEGMEEITEEDMRGFDEPKLDKKLLQEGTPVELGAAIIGGALSSPKILMLIGKALRNLHKTPIIGRFFKNLESEEGKPEDQQSRRKKVADALYKAGGDLHTWFVKGFSIPVRMYFKYKAKKDPDFDMPDEKVIKAVGEALMVLVIAVCAAIGFKAVIKALMSGNAGILAAGESALVSVKGVEMGEYGAKITGTAIPLALKFLVTPHEHHDDDHGEKKDSGEENELDKKQA